MSLLLNDIPRSVPRDLRCDLSTRSIFGAQPNQLS
jgi:hypothetical protein